MRIALKSLGCRVNEAELERWSREFRAAGHRIVEAPEPADLVVLNSCAVTEEAVRKSRSTLRRIHREQPQAKLLLSGCYASLSGVDTDSLGIDLIIPNSDKDRLVDIAERELTLGGMPALGTDPESGSVLPSHRQRAFVKVQDGCRYRCTFCIVTVARGEERSRPIRDVVEEINTLVESGVKEVVLTGVHLGGYGSDSGSSLDRLIHAILAETGIARIRLGSLEPWELPEQFFDLFADSRVMPHLHLPLQSGSDSILKRMARRCRTDEFARLLQQARSAVPDINITTDVIVGFPGENDEEWQRSLRFIEAMAFGHIHIFTYSRREGTAAASMPNQIAAEIKRARSRALHELAEEMKTAFHSRFLNRSFPILVEGFNAGMVQGYTPNYIRVSAEYAATESAVNRLLDIQLTHFDETSGWLSGRLAPT